MTSKADLNSQLFVQQPAAAARDAFPSKAPSSSLGVNPLTGCAADKNDVRDSRDVELLARLLKVLFPITTVSATEKTADVTALKIYRYTQDQMIKDWKIHIPAQPAGLSFCFEELSIECPRELSQVQIKDIMETALLSVWNLRFEGDHYLRNRFNKLDKWEVTFRASGEKGCRKLPVNYPSSFMGE